MRKVPWYVKLCRGQDEESRVYEVGDLVYISKASNKCSPRKFIGKKVGPVKVHRVYPGKMELEDKNGDIFKVELESPEEEAHAIWAMYVPI